MATFSAEMADLEREGPVIDVSFSPVRAFVDAARQNDPAWTPPMPVAARALIDTGASGTAVQAGLLDSLGLQPVGVLHITTPTSQNHPCSAYAVRLDLPRAYLELTVIEAPLQGQNIEVLIGRDVLKHGVFIYQGHNSQFTLSF